MAFREDRVDFSPNERMEGSVTAAAVPRYILYGESGSRLDWFVNVEPLDRRGRECDWVIAPHTHPHFTQLVICTRGGGEMTIEGDVQRFTTGSVMVVPPYRIHGFRYEEATVGRVVTVENGYLTDLLTRAPALKVVLGTPGVFNLETDVLPGLEAECEALSRELGGRQKGCAIGAEIHLLAVLLRLLRYWPPTAAKGAARGAHFEIVERLKVLVEERYRGQPPLTEVAGHLGVSVSQLRLACKRVTGMTPNAIFHNRIMAEAKRCLAYTAISIVQLSEHLGFSDPSYFSRFFTKLSGGSPTEYRKAYSFSAGQEIDRITTIEQVRAEFSDFQIVDRLDKSS